jgi:hypothetical protein
MGKAAIGSDDIVLFTQRRSQPGKITGAKNNAAFQENTTLYIQLFPYFTTIRQKTKAPGSKHFINLSGGTIVANIWLPLKTLLMILATDGTAKNAGFHYEIRRLYGIVHAR